MLEKGTYFSGQKADKNIINNLRRHPLAFLTWMLVISGLIISLIIPLWIFRDNIKILFSQETVTLHLLNIVQIYEGSYLHLTIMFVSSYILFIFALSLTAWMNYYLDITTITSTHLTNIRHTGLFNRQVAEQSLTRVQDVSSRMRGLLQTYFRFGTVYVETAGESPNFKMVNIPRPHKIANTIMELHEALIRKTREGPEEEKVYENKNRVIKQNVPSQIDAVEKEQKTQKYRKTDINQDPDNQESLIKLATISNKNNNKESHQEGELKEGTEIKL